MDKSLENTAGIKLEKLRHIPFNTSKNEPIYTFLKEVSMEEMEEYKELLHHASAITCILTCIFNSGDDIIMDENGLEKMLMMIFGAIFMIQNDDVDSKWLYETLYDIHCFETGDYESLVIQEDLALMREDMELIKSYANADSKLWDERFSDEDLFRVGIVRPKQ